MTVALQIQLSLVCALVAAWAGGVILGRRLRHRDLRRAQLRRVMEYRA